MSITLVVVELFALIFLKL